MSADWKVITAVSFAVVGLGAAIISATSVRWTPQVRPHLREAPPAPSENARAAAGTEGQGMPDVPELPSPPDYEFQRVRNDADMEAALEELSDAFVMTADENTDLRRLGATASQQLPQDAQAAFEPLLSGDANGYQAVLESLGAIFPDPAEGDGRQSSLFKKVADMLRHADIDVSQIVIRPSRSMGQPIGGGPGRPGGPGGGPDRAEMLMRTAGVFSEEVENYRTSGLPAFDVFVPVKPEALGKNAAGFEFGLTFVWNSQQKQWLPVDLHFAAADPQDLRSVMQLMKD